jgi:hypothetical protein
VAALPNTAVSNAPGLCASGASGSQFAALDQFRSAGAPPSHVYVSAVGALAGVVASAASE